MSVICPSKDGNQRIEMRENEGGDFWQAKLSKEASFEEDVT